MSYRIERYEQEYRRTLASAALASVAAHVLLAFMLSRGSPLAPVQRPAVALGYQGPKHILPELEVREPNSVQSYFSQAERRGTTHAREYRVVQPLDATPGPDPLPRRHDARPSPQRVEVVSPSPELLEPQPATQAKVSFAEEFVILRAVRPVYPEYELSRGVRGWVLVAVWVTPNGDIEDEQVREARCEPPDASTRGFEIAALEAVRQWKVKPPKLDNRAKGFWLTIPIRFVRPDGDDFMDLDGVKVP